MIDNYNKKKAHQVHHNTQKKKKLTMLVFITKHTKKNSLATTKHTKEDEDDTYIGQ